MVMAATAALVGHDVGQILALGRGHPLYLMVGLFGELLKRTGGEDGVVVLEVIQGVGDDCSCLDGAVAVVEVVVVVAVAGTVHEAAAGRSLSFVGSKSRRGGEVVAVDDLGFLADEAQCQRFHEVLPATEVHVHWPR